MTYVATEICSETGSWKADFVLNSPPIMPKNRNLILDRKSKLFESLSKFHAFSSNKVVIRKLSKMEECLSYEIHTNRELDLMLSGGKPLSVFHAKDGESYDVFNGQKFRKFSSIIKSRKIRIGDVTVYFKYLHGEDWRVDAYILIYKVRSYFGNSAHLEIVEGELLGYSSEQNIEYIEKFWKKFERQ